MKKQPLQDQQITCIDCGTAFTFTVGEQQFYNAQHFSPPKRCKTCREKRKQQRTEAKRIADESLFEEKLKDYTVIPVSDIHPDNPLYIIGNGFDLTHVPDKRYTKDAHRFYIFILDVVANTHLELEPFDAIETYVERLRDTGLIVLKKGRASDSLDYHDYIITEDRELFYNWMNCKMKQKIEMIGSLVPDLSIGA